MPLRHFPSPSLGEEAAPGGSAVWEQVVSTQTKLSPQTPLIPGCEMVNEKTWFVLGL